MFKISKLEELLIYKNEIKEMYNNNISLKEIGKKFNCSGDTIKRFIVKNNFPERGKINPLYKNFSDSEINKMVQLYQQGYSEQKIADMFNTSDVTVGKKLEAKGIAIRDLHTARKRYNYNECYFENIDNEHKAYWLGFIAADGCILRSTTGISKKNRKTY